MKFVRFIENRYQELTHLQSQSTAFEAKVDAEIKAAHDLLTFYRWVLKWILMPKVIGDFFLVKLNLKPQPEPVIMNEMKKKQEEEKAKLAKKKKDPEISV
jgi:hypothetical protein